MSNRKLPACAATLLAGVAVPCAVHAAAPDPAKDYPTKPIRLVAPFVPGGGTDTTARTIAQKLSERWGQQVVVDNRTGAAGAIGVEITAQAIPDGYTICVISASHAVLSATNDKLPYDFNRDLQGITQATSLFYVLTVPAALPPKSVKELVAYAKTHPGKLNFASSGVGSLQHFSWELFKHLTGTRFTHVPYKGAAGSLVGMLAGEVQLGFFSMFGVRPHLNSGRVRVLAITASKRSPLLPEYPTVAEAGVPGYEVDQWYGFVTAAKVPRPIVAKLQAAMADTLKVPEIVQRLGTDGSTPVGTRPEQFHAHLQAEISRWRRLVKDAGLALK